MSIRNSVSMREVNSILPIELLVIPQNSGTPEQRNFGTVTATNQNEKMIIRYDIYTHTREINESLVGEVTFYFDDTNWVSPHHIIRTGVDLEIVLDINTNGYITLGVQNSNTTYPVTISGDALVKIVSIV